MGRAAASQLAELAAALGPGRGADAYDSFASDAATLQMWSAAPAADEGHDDYEGSPELGGESPLLGVRDDAGVEGQGEGGDAVGVGREGDEGEGDEGEEGDEVEVEEGEVSETETPAAPQLAVFPHVVSVPAAAVHDTLPFDAEAEALAGWGVEAPPRISAAPAAAQAEATDIAPTMVYEEGPAHGDEEGPANGDEELGGEDTQAAAAVLGMSASQASGFLDARGLRRHQMPGAEMEVTLDAMPATLEQGAALEQAPAAVEAAAVEEGRAAPGQGPAAALDEPPAALAQDPAAHEQWPAALEQAPVAQDEAPQVASPALDPRRSESAHAPPQLPSAPSQGPCSGRRRIMGKRPRPADFEAAPPPARADTAVLRSAIGHSLAPPEMGSRVRVKGDGWGVGRGSYVATVTEADELTFTVIRQCGERWEETHVLREHCTVLVGGEKRRRSG